MLLRSIGRWGSTRGHVSIWGILLGVVFLPIDVEPNTPPRRRVGGEMAVCVSTHRPGIFLAHPYREVRVDTFGTLTVRKIASIDFDE